MNLHAAIMANLGGSAVFILCSILNVVAMRMRLPVSRPFLVFGIEFCFGVLVWLVIYRKAGRE
jgi:hypothetical protein